MGPLLKVPHSEAEPTKLAGTLPSPAIYMSPRQGGRVEKEVEGGILRGHLAEASRN